jgi:uncharacterized protein (TIGR02246 family)
MNWLPRFCALASAACLAGTVNFQAEEKKEDRQTEPPVQINPLKTNETEAEPAAEIPAEEQPFWDSAKAFVNAYARRDAEAIGEMFTEDAVFRDEFGVQTEGREAIVQMFEDVFAANPEALVEGIDIQRIRYVTPEVVMEEGLVYVTETLDEPVYTNRYIALHVKGLDDVWRINSLKDFTRQPLSKSQHLDQLQWLIGDWVNEETSEMVETSCRWSDDGSYLLRRYRVETMEGEELDGVQRIGWDPLRKQLRSWQFDSEGGFSDSYWVRNGNQWVVTTQGTTAEGEPLQATSVYTIVDEERIIWQITSLVIGGEIMPENQAVVMMRKPPEPLTAESASGE